MAITTLNKRYAIHIYKYYCYIDLVDSSSTAPPSSDPLVEEHLSLDPPDDDPSAEDDDDEEEELEAQPTAAEIVQAGVTWGQLDKETIP